MFKTISKIKEVAKRDQKEREQMRLVWFFVIVFMCGVFCVWVAGVNNDLKKLSGIGVDVSGLPEMPESEEGWGLGDVMNDLESLTAVQQDGNESANWKETGDNYLVGQEIFSGDDNFSLLKFSGYEIKGDGTYITYGHYYKDIQVSGSDYVLVFDDSSKEFLRAENNLIEGIGLGIEPQISLKEASEIVKKKAGAEYELLDGGLVISEYEDDFYLMWRIFLEDDGNIYEALVGAKNGGLVALTEAEGLEG